MFKLVVLSALFAAAAAEPGVVTPFGYAAPLAYSSVVTPGFTTIAKQASSVVHPLPISYTAPLTFGHFIKKRSAPAFFAPTTYIANTRLAAAPLAYTSPLAYSAPAVVHSAPILTGARFPLGAHFIKKRSAPAFTVAALPAPYIGAQPLLTSTYAATPLLHSSPLISSPILTPHFIKKRSAPLLSTYLAPTAYSSQSRFDYTQTSPSLVSTTYSSPIPYASHIAYSSVL